MLFNSPEFIFVFLPLALLGCVAAAHLAGANGAVAVLVAASFIFYAYWRVDDLILLVVSIAFNYVVGQAIARMVDQGEAQAARRLLVAGIAFNLLLIAVFKYSGFFARSANSILGLDLTVPQFELPLGISFFTFTQITFLADVYGRRTRETSPLRYALFVTFFPHLIAGPILHQRMMTPQFQQKTFGRPDLDQISAGLIFFVVGLFKKQLLADPMGSYANPVFDAAAAGSAVTPWEAWAGTLAYTMQIYFDFSGYSDMAVGLGLLFGVRLPVNFASPYKAESIVDFWRRWHITLSQFLRDYVYIPLGGNRDGRIMRYRNLLLTMLLGGLWHGANWTFVIWGGLHGLFICVNHAWQGLSVPHFGLPLWIRRSLSCGITFLSVVLAWVPFRADSLATTLRLWRIMAGFEGVPLPAPIA